MIASLPPIVKVEMGSAALFDSSPDTATIRLLDGSTIFVRPITPFDHKALQRFHERHSEQAVYARFFAFQPALSDKQASYFTELDGVERVALVALDPRQPSEIIGVARFDRESGTTRAEYAAIVAEAWQGRGLGRQLTCRLIDAARRRGVTMFYAYVLPGNLPMLDLLRGLGLPESVRDEAQVQRIEVDLAGDVHDGATRLVRDAGAGMP